MVVSERFFSGRNDTLCRLVVVCHFLYAVLLAPVLIFFSTIANAQNSNWVSYHQHGYGLELPDFFLPVASQDSSKDVFTNTNNKDITLYVESTPIDKIA